jgi:hypothetical protein
VNIFQGVLVFNHLLFINIYFLPIDSRKSGKSKTILPNNSITNKEITVDAAFRNFNTAMIFWNTMGLLDSTRG